MARPRRRSKPGVTPFGVELTPRPSTDLYSFRLGGKTFVVLSLPAPRRRRPAAALSAAEQQVAALVLRGLSNAEIAASRRVAVRTVCNQIASLYRKLGVGSRAELAALDRFRGAGRLP